MNEPRALNFRADVGSSEIQLFDEHRFGLEKFQEVSGVRLGAPAIA